MPRRTRSKSFSFWVRSSASFFGLWLFFFLLSFCWTLLLGSFLFVSVFMFVSDALATALLLSADCVLCSCWPANAVFVQIVAYTHITAALISKRFIINLLKNSYNARHR